MNQIRKGYLYVVLSAILFGCMPLGAKYIYANGVNALSLVFYRNCLAIPVMILLVVRRKESLFVTSKQLPQIIWLAAVGCCLTPVLLFTSYQYISSGTATTFHFIYPAMVIFGGTVLFRQKARPGQLLCVLLCTAGVGMFYAPGEALHPLGSLLALLSGITYAIYILFLSRSQLGTLSGVKLSLYMAMVCSTIMLAVCLATGQFTLPATPACWLVCFVFSVALCVGAVVLFQRGTFLIGGQKASILSTFEPITSIFVGILVFHEPFSWRTVLGALCVVAAAILIAAQDLRNAAPTQGSPTSS